MSEKIEKFIKRERNGNARMPAYDLPKTEHYPINLVNPPAIEQRLSNDEIKALRKSPLELILAQNNSPSQSIDKKAQMDYNEIARKAGRILKPDSYKDVLAILQPYEEDPKNQSDLFFNNLGVAYSYSREPKKAESALIKAIKFNPNEEAQRFNLAYLYLTQFSEPQYKKIAEEHLTYILQHINPSSTPARVYLNRIKTGKI